MSNNFKRYAQYYDLIYREKNYARECAFLKQIFRRYIGNRSISILDLACGTAGHAILLAKDGYKICGVDMSRQMVDIAKEKSICQGLDIDFYVNTMQHFTFNKKFDAVIMMFASIDYLRNARDLKTAFWNISRHLKKGGLLIFDFWNGLAVMHDFIAKSSKVIRNQDIKIKRISVKHLEPIRQKCAVNFIFSVYKQNKLIDSFRERHIIRYFFPEEMRNYLEFSEFKVLKICPFLKLNKEISEKDWDITVIAKKA